MWCLFTIFKDKSIIRNTKHLSWVWHTCLYSSILYCPTHLALPDQFNFCFIVSSSTTKVTIISFCHRLFCKGHDCLKLLLYFVLYCRWFQPLQLLQILNILSLLPADLRLYFSTSHRTSLFGSLRNGSRNIAAGIRYMSLLEPSDW